MDWYGLNDESILPRDKWRKSEQWFGLMRPHAELVADENNTLWKYMLQQCPLSNVDGNGEEKKCILDEHYPATALAIAGKEWESDCYGHLHFTEWRDGGAMMNVVDSLRVCLLPKRLCYIIKQPQHSQRSIRFRGRARS